MPLDSSLNETPDEKESSSKHSRIQRVCFTKQSFPMENASYQCSPSGQSATFKLPREVKLQSIPQEENAPQKKCSLYRGIIFAALSSVFFSTSSVIVKYLTLLHPGQLAVVRFIGIFIFTMPVMIYKKQATFGPKGSRHFLIIRGLVGATSLILRFYAFRYLPIADASVIVFSVPVFVAIFARIFLKELCGVFHVVSIVITLLGVFLITKMPLVLAEGIDYNTERLYGVLAGVGSTLFGAAVYVVIRKMKSVHHSVIMFNFGWVAIIETTILTILLGYFSLPRCGTNQWLMMSLGFCSFSGQTFLTLAVQEEQASAVAIVRAAVDIVIAFVWQILFFEEIPDAYSISGALLVSLCVFLISIRKWALSLSEDSRTRRYLHFLTL